LYLVIASRTDEDVPRKSCPTSNQGGEKVDGIMESENLEEEKEGTKEYRDDELAAGESKKKFS